MSERDLLEQVLRELSRLNAKVEQLETSKRLPALLTAKEAAIELGYGVTKVKALVSAGRLLVVKEEGEHPRIPSREIERYVRSAKSLAEKPRTSGGRPKATRHDGKSVAAEVKAALKADRLPTRPKKR